VLSWMLSLGLKEVERLEATLSVEADEEANGFGVWDLVVDDEPTLDVDVAGGKFMLSFQPLLGTKTGALLFVETTRLFVLRISRSAGFKLVVLGPDRAGSIIEACFSLCVRRGWGFDVVFEPEPEDTGRGFETEELSPLLFFRLCCVSEVGEAGRLLEERVRRMESPVAVSCVVALLKDTFLGES